MLIMFFRKISLRNIAFHLRDSAKADINSNLLYF